MTELAGGFPGEGADEGVVGLGGAVLDAPRSPKGQDPGLARPRAGHDAQGAGLGVHCRPLAVGERTEIENGEVVVRWFHRVGGYR